MIKLRLAEVYFGALFIFLAGVASGGWIVWNHIKYWKETDGEGDINNSENP